MSVLFVRRARREIFGENLFSDPAWDILLELFGAELARRSMSATELATTIQAPLAITKRWIALLVERGLIEPADIGDDDRVITLSSSGAERMDRLANRWASAFVAIS
jgi:DNA-binding MarR family transcriptional regulator